MIAMIRTPGGIAAALACWLVGLIAGAPAHAADKAFQTFIESTWPDAALADEAICSPSGPLKVNAEPPVRLDPTNQP